MVEGWILAVPESGRFDIQRFDESDRFRSDDEASEHVERLAQNGNDLHQRAWALVGEPADEDYAVVQALGLSRGTWHELPPIARVKLRESFRS